MQILSKLIKILPKTILKKQRYKILKTEEMTYLQVTVDYTDYI